MGYVVLASICWLLLSTPVGRKTLMETKKYELHINSSISPSTLLLDVSATLPVSKLAFFNPETLFVLSL